MLINVLLDWLCLHSGDLIYQRYDHKVITTSDGTFAVGGRWNTSIVTEVMVNR